MNKTIILSITMMLSISLMAQDLPRPSPNAMVEQVVGLTEISLQYSRPSVKGRTVWGDLVPYDKVWRFGANEATRIRTSTDMTFGDVVIKAGYYALLCTPSEKGDWQIHVNTDTTLRGAGDYDAEKNVATLIGQPKDNPEMTESMSITIEDLTAESGSIVFKWAQAKLKLPFTVPTDATAEKNINSAIEKGENLDQVYYTAASYYYNTKKNEGEANNYLTKSLEVKENHRVYYLRGRMAESKDNMDEAIKNWTKGVELATAAESKGWADFMQGLIDDNTKPDEK